MQMSQALYNFTALPLFINGRTGAISATTPATSPAMMSPGNLVERHKTNTANVSFLEILLINRIDILQITKKLLSKVRCLIVLLELDNPKRDAPILNESPKSEPDRDTLRR
jgi:hypothetical protein